MSDERRTIWLFGILGAIALGVALVLLLPRLLGSPDPMLEPRGTDTPPREAPDAQAVPPRVEAQSEREPRSRIEAAPQPAAVPAPGEPALLRLIDEQDRPVASAEVVFRDHSDLPTDVRSLPLGHPRLVALSAGRDIVLRSDARGEVTLPVFRAEAVVEARAEKLFGARRLGAHERRPYVLSLRADRTLEVRTERNGTPVPDVPIALFSQAALTPTLAAAPLWLGRTGPDGVAIIPNVRSYVAQESRTEADRRTASFVTVGLAFPLRAPVQQTLDPEALPEEAVRLEVPPTGALNLFLLDDRDEAYTDPVRLFLGSRPPDTGPFALEMTAEGGSVSLPMVEIDFRFGISAEPVDASLRPVQVEVETPERANEYKDVPIRFGARNPIVTARLLDPNGRPVANRGVRLVPWTSDRRRSPLPYGKGTTDAEGLLQCALPLENRGHRWRYPVPYEKVESLAIQVPLDGLEKEANTQDPPDGEQPEWSAKIPFTPIEEGETRHLGDIRLESVPLLVAGTVLDPAGRPLPGARVVVGNPRRRVVDRTDDEGRYEIRRLPGVTDLTLVGYHREYRDSVKNRTFVPGDNPVEIRMRGVTTLEGTLVLAPGVPRERLKLRIESPRRQNSIRVDRNGGFRFYVPTGPATLLVEVTGDERPVASIGPIELERGQRNDIGEIDLRDKIRAFVVRVLSPSGEPVGGALFTAVHRRPRRPNEFGFGNSIGRADAFGRMPLVTGADAIPVEVQGAGFRPQEFTLAPVDRDLVLAEATRLELSVDNQDTAVPDGYRLEARIYESKARSRSKQTIRRVGPRQDDPPSDAFLLSYPGGYEVYWCLVPEKARADEFGTSISEPQSIQVGESDTLVRHTTTILPGDLESARLRAERRKEPR